MIKLLINLFFLSIIPIYGSTSKTPSDTFAQGYLLKQKVIYLRKEANIIEPFPVIEKQVNKQPRHVLQKALEVLYKINKYRINHNYGAISIPSYPSRPITPNDVYVYTKRLNDELSVFCDKKFLEHLEHKQFANITPSDVYRILWEVSLGFDKLLGIGGFTPTDVYEQSQTIVDIAKFLRQSQGIFQELEKPKVKIGLHPNHALNSSYKLLEKISKIQKKLWMTPTKVPSKVYKVTTPTQVYDSLQNIIAELQRLKTRLGLERYFQIKQVKGDKTPSDVVANLQYAKMLLPDFSVNKYLNQYDPHKLIKTPNEVYGLSVDIIEKLVQLSFYKGIELDMTEPEYIYGLQPKHVYQKSIEAIEKVIKLKTKEGFFRSNIPDQPFRTITPSEVYEQVERLNSIVTLILQKNYDKNVKQYRYETHKKKYTDKTPSDVYRNIWLISKILDQLIGTTYTPNETFVLAQNIEHYIDAIITHFNIKHNQKYKIQAINKTPNDVFNQSIILYDTFKKVLLRANIKDENIIIPRETKTTPTTVYNALRIIMASINEFMISYNIPYEHIKFDQVATNKTPSDVFIIVKRSNDKLNRLFDDENY